MVRLLLASLLFAPVACASSSPTPGAPEARKYAVYVGNYSGPLSKGIMRFELDAASGACTEPTLAAEMTNPSFLAIHPGGKFVYAVGEVGGQKGGAVAAFAIGAGGALTPLNTQTSGGNGPCHITVDPSGKTALVANYGGGSVQSLPIGADGKLGEPGTFVQHKGSSVNKGRQSEPHAHSFNPSADGKFAFCADLGLDQVLIYKLDAAAGKLAPNDPPHVAVPPGSGPRHFAFHPNGKFAYVCGEMTSTAIAMAYDAAKGSLQVIQTLSTLPNEVKGNSTAEVVVHPSGKVLYVSNRGHDSLAVFAIGADGKLTAKGHVPTGGKTPRNFAVTPCGKWLLAANQNSDSITVFKVGADGAELSAVGSVKTGKPVCVRFLALP
jgi:6-phosphogluconolactonase